MCWLSLCGGGGSWLTTSLASACCIPFKSEPPVLHAPRAAERGTQHACTPTMHAPRLHACSAYSVAYSRTTCIAFRYLAGSGPWATNPAHGRIISFFLSFLLSIFLWLLHTLCAAGWQPPACTSCDEVPPIPSLHLPAFLQPSFLQCQMPFSWICFSRVPPAPSGPAMAISTTAYASATLLCSKTGC